MSGKKPSDKSGKPTPQKRTVAQNRKAYHHYEVVESLTAGIVLTGTEIKSIRQGKLSIAEAFGRVKNGEVFLHGMTIQPYDNGTHYNHEPDRVRKLLLNKQEIRKLIGKTQQAGLTLVPLKLYFERCWIKVELGLCKGKKTIDKRESIKQREQTRELQRAFKLR